MGVHLDNSHNSYTPFGTNLYRRDVHGTMPSRARRAGSNRNSIYIYSSTREMVVVVKNVTGAAALLVTGVSCSVSVLRWCWSLCAVVLVVWQTFFFRTRPVPPKAIQSCHRLVVLTRAHRQRRTVCQTLLHTAATGSSPLHHR